MFGSSDHDEIAYWQTMLRRLFVARHVSARGVISVLARLRKLQHRPHKGDVVLRAHRQVYGVASAYSHPCIDDLIDAPQAVIFDVRR